MAKRASTSSSSGQPSQPKRRYLAPTGQVRNGPERNLVPGSCSTEEDGQRVCGKEPERAKSHSAEYCQSCTGNALKDIVRQMHSMENSIPKLVREELERYKPEWAELVQSCFRNALKDIVPQICSENDFHRLKEAVEPANSDSPHLGRVNAKSTANNGERNLLLQLQTKLSLPLFTGKKIEGEEGARIYVALIDANTGDAVTSGPESSIKLDVVVLEGDFNKDNQDNWAQEEFEKYVAKERAGKGPLLTGDLLVTLKGGVGGLGDLIFTDNSSWNRSQRFRIGLKVASGYCGNTRIQEAVTDAFRVREHRGELYKKHYPPASDDEVWRLEKIAKDGKSLHKLSDAGIQKVEDFLLQLFTDSKKLKEILGKSITSKSWDILVNHAMTCKTNWKLYLYYLDGTRKHGAVFNTDSQLIGLIKDRVCFATHRLSAQEKEHGDTIVKKALDNWNDVREFNGETFSGSMQKKSSSSFPSQVFEEQVVNLNPVQRNLAPPFFVTPVGLEAPLASAISNAEVLSPGHNGATALALPIELPNTNSGNAMKLSVDESVRLAALQPISTDHLNVLIPQGDNGIPTVGLPMQSHGNNFQYAMQSHTIHSSSQMGYTVNENAPPSGPPSAAISRFQSSATLPPPEGNHMMEDLQPFVSDDMDYWLALLSQSPPHDGGSVRGTSKGVHGWIKLKAVMKWGIFVRKIATTRRVGIVQLDEPPIEVQA
ncbi:calmodulin-binding protein 60 D-like [Syzygium oleosum]|uniref:calmodulin-binding protein 60 D-like n=1 Tax=Syzygium oleosum TaxID=219896 RepID=UPI0024B991D9|nr:calmodulin-binding protein 60 D-like [Syzygium oleosum]